LPRASVLQLGLRPRWSWSNWSSA